MIICGMYANAWVEVSELQENLPEHMAFSLMARHALLSSALQECSSAKLLTSPLCVCGGGAGRGGAGNSWGRFWIPQDPVLLHQGPSVPRTLETCLRATQDFCLLM